MPDSLPFQKIDYEIPLYVNADGTKAFSPFSKTALDHYKDHDLRSAGIGGLEKMRFFAKHVAEMHRVTKANVPYRFIDRTGQKYSMDNGALKFLGPEGRDLVEYVLQDDFIVAVKPKPKMLQHFKLNSSIIGDIDEIRSSGEIPETEKKALISARIGQGKYRKDLLELWDDACAVTGTRLKRIIRASHILPWRHSDNEQRLNPHNGLPLAATLDAFFDAGLISFTDKGDMLISPEISNEDRKAFLSVTKLRKSPSEKTASFLTEHRIMFGHPME